MASLEIGTSEARREFLQELVRFQEKSSRNPVDKDDTTGSLTRWRGEGQWVEERSEEEKKEKEERREKRRRKGEEKE